MFFTKSKAIKERASYLYRLMYKENTEVELTRSSYYDNVFRASAYVGGKHYQIHFNDCYVVEMMGLKYEAAKKTNNMKIAKFVALNIARVEYGKQTIRYIESLSESLSLN